MKVEVLYFSGCPHHDSTMDLVREVAAELGIPADIEPIEVTDPGSASRLRFFGSPTVRIDGRDIEPSARTSIGYAYGCRVYGSSGTPPRQLVRAAFEEARSA